MKYKRPLAIAAVVLLLLLYASSIIFAMIDSPLAQSLLMASLFCTVVVPAVLYGYSLIIRYKKDNQKKDKPE
ncbi:MAG: hypothetical protein RR225_05685 [Clostridium sp.]